MHPRNLYRFGTSFLRHTLRRSPQDIAQIVAEQKDPKTLAEQVKPLAEHGTNQHREERGLDIIKSSTTGGTSASYLTARLARDFPAVLEEMKAGTYPSVRAAAKAAGILDDFARCPPDGQAAFAHTWVSKIATRLEETWPLFYHMLKVIEDQQVYKNARVIGSPHVGPKSYATFREYFEAEVKEPFEQWAELEQTYHFVTTYAPHLFDRQYSEARTAKVAALAMVPMPLAASRRPTKEEAANKGTNSTLKIRGTTKEYLTARIARDHPQILAQMQAGKYPSVRAAAVEFEMSSMAPIKPFVRMTLLM